MEIKIILTEAEEKALSYVASSPQEWAENAVKERARIAMNEIFQAEVQSMLLDPNINEIPADVEKVVLAANIESAADRQSKIDQETGV
jgi:hypothetical protein